jgi:hypothetical protein
MAVMTDIGSSSNHLVEHVRFVEPAGLASSSLCYTVRRKSTATEALLSACFSHRGENLRRPTRRAARDGRAEMRSIVTDEARVHIFVSQEDWNPQPAELCGRPRWTTEAP